MRLEFLHGTETGTAEIVCEDLDAAVTSSVETAIHSLEDIDPSALESDPLYVIVCSTFGSGDLPSTAEPFVEKLNAQKPDPSPKIAKRTWLRSGFWAFSFSTKGSAVEGRSPLPKVEQTIT